MTLPLPNNARGGALCVSYISRLMSLLLDQCKKGITVIVVTHEEDIASYVRRTIYLRDGKIIEGKKR